MIELAVLVATIAGAVILLWHGRTVYRFSYRFGYRLGLLLAGYRRAPWL